MLVLDGAVVRTRDQRRISYLIVVSNLARLNNIKTKSFSCGKNVTLVEETNFKYSAR
jgi:hypothetical protein